MCFGFCVCVCLGIYAELTHQGRDMHGIKETIKVQLKYQFYLIHLEKLTLLLDSHI